MVSKRSLVSLLLLSLFCCRHTPPKVKVADSWLFKGLEPNKIVGKCLRVWEKPSYDFPANSFLVLEVLKGTQEGKLHIGFLIQKSDLGFLGFYDYDQRQKVDLKINGRLYQGLSLRRVNWDSQRDFIGVLNQGNSIGPAQEIYKGLFIKSASFVLSLAYTSGKKEKRVCHFELSGYSQYKAKKLKSLNQRDTGGGT